MKPKQSQTTDAGKRSASPTDKSSPRGSRGTTAAMQEAADLQARIATRAYELYQQRGSQDGYALEDWLQAEREIRRAEQRGRAGR